MKRVFLIILLLSMLSMSACMCLHHWEEACCTSPKICTDCGKTEGEALGHSWMAASCTAPKACNLCGKTRGDPLGHSWIAASCTVPKTCKVCGVTEGEAGGHLWQAAGCLTPKTCALCAKTEGEPTGHFWTEATTEMPKHCTQCRLTEGDRILTDPRFTTEQAKLLIGDWNSKLAVTGSDMGYPDFTGVLQCNVDLRLGNAGDMEVTVTALNLEEFKTVLTGYVQEVVYQEFADMGLNKTAAELAIKAYSGMTVSQYSASLVEDMDIESMIAAFNQTGVYYVADGLVYYGESWAGKMDASPYTLEKGRLTIRNLALAYGKTLAFDPMENEG